MNKDFQPWIPGALRRGIRAFMYPLSHDSYEFFPFPKEVANRLLNDTRLVPFWQWAESVGIPAMVDAEKTRHVSRNQESEQAIAQTKATVMFWIIGESFVDPDRIASMIASERSEYFSHVSATATKLLGLLKGTGFDKGMWNRATWYSREQAQGLIDDDLKTAHEHPNPYTAWRTLFYDEEDGFWSMAPDFPLSNFTVLLKSLIKWSNNPDCLGEFFAPYTPVKQRGRRGLKARALINLSRHFRSNDWLGVTIPYNHLAELVNVGLDLPEDEQLNQTAARKQIERWATEEDKTG